MGGRVIIEEGFGFWICLDFENGDGINDVGFENCFVGFGRVFGICVVCERYYFVY